MPSFDRRIAGIALSIATLTSTSCVTLPPVGVTFTPAQLQSMVQSGNYPREGTPVTNSESIGWSACIAKVETLLKTVGPNYPSQVTVSTPITQTVKLWTNDGALTLTCIATDGELIITRAQYQ